MRCLWLWMFAHTCTLALFLSLLLLQSSRSLSPIPQWFSIPCLRQSLQQSSQCSVGGRAHSYYRVSGSRVDKERQL
jgi:hypothetical protein